MPGTTPQNPGKMKEIRKAIARILTIEREEALKGKKRAKFVKFAVYQKSFVFAKLFQEKEKNSLLEPKKENLEEWSQ